MYNIEEYKLLIKERLSPYRYYHSLCVAESAVKLAKKYGADLNKAEAAGILHDVCKEETAENQLELIRKAGFELTEAEVKNQKFYHQASGAAYAKTVLKIDDDEIINAVRYHTTGRRGMSLMEEIIYLADFISADRDYDDIDSIRAETEKGKERGLMYAAGYTIKSVVDKGAYLHPFTTDLYNDLLEKYFNSKRKG